MLTRDEILGVSDLPTTDVDVPEWGGKVRIRGWTVGARQAFLETMLQAGKGEAVPAAHALIAAHACIDADGNPLFTVADVEALAGKSPRVLDRIYEAFNALNAETAEAIDELEKN